MVDRIATFVRNSTLMNQVLRQQKNYYDYQLQTTTGLKSQTLDGIAPDAERLLTIEAQLSQAQAKKPTLTMAADRIEVQSDAMKRMVDTLNTFLSSLAGATSGVSFPAALLNNATQARDDFAAALNVKHAGWFMFSGSQTNTAPVDLTDPGYVALPVPPSAVNTAYYQGDTYLHDVDIDSAYTVQYGMLADNPAFEQALRGFSLVMGGPANQAAIDEAFALLQTSVQEIAALLEQQSAKANAINKALLEIDEEIDLAEDMQARLKGADIAEATIKLKETETLIENSYSSIAQILRFSLLDFLR